MHIGQVTKLRLSCFLVLLTVNSKTRYQDSHSSVTWPIYRYILFHTQGHWIFTACLIMQHHMCQVTELWLCCYLGMLSIDIKPRWQDSSSFVTWPICYHSRTLGLIPGAEWPIVVTYNGVIISICVGPVWLGLSHPCRKDMHYGIWHPLLNLSDIRVT